MINLTAEQIAAAKANDLDAVTAVLSETEARIGQHARSYATTGSRLDHELMEDLAQIGRIAVWEAIEKFEGSEVAQFFSFADRTISGAMANERRAMVRQGVSQGTAASFEFALSQAGGDPYEAERVAQNKEIMKQDRMTAETALAARMSWQGTASLDMPVSTGPWSGDGTRGVAVATVGESIPDPASLPDDLATDTDRERARQREIKGYVHAALGKMSDRARSILKGTYGIEGTTPYFGTENEGEFAAHLGIPRTSDLRSQRAKAKSRFRDVYLAGPAALLPEATYASHPIAAQAA